jgi:hypothetical protein
MTTDDGPTPEELMKRFVLTVPEAGIVLGLRASAAYEAAAKGDIPCILVNGRKRVPVVRLKALLEGEQS